MGLLVVSMQAPYTDVGIPRPARERRRDPASPADDRRPRARECMIRPNSNTTRAARSWSSPGNCSVRVSSLATRLAMPPPKLALESQLPTTRTRRGFLRVTGRRWRGCLAVGLRGIVSWASDPDLGRQPRDPERKEGRGHESHRKGRHHDDSSPWTTSRVATTSVGRCVFSSTSLGEGSPRKR